MPRRRRASAADDDRRRRREDSSDSDGYFQAPLVVKPMASPLRESAAPYRSPDTKEYKHAAKHNSLSFGGHSSSGSDEETGDESGSHSGSNSDTSSNSENDSESTGTSSDSDHRILKAERSVEKPPNGKSNLSRNSPKESKKRKSSRCRSESPYFKRIKENSKRSQSPGQGGKLSPAQRKPVSPVRRSPRRERRNSAVQNHDRRRSDERRRSPKRNTSPRRRSPRRDPHTHRRESSHSRSSYSQDQQNKSEKRERRSSPRVESRRDIDSKRDGDSRREISSRRESDSRRDRVRVKSEKNSPERPKHIKQELRSPEISKWDDDHDRKPENRRPKSSERPRNKRDRASEMKRKTKEIDEAERKHQWGKQEIKQEDESNTDEKQKPNLGLSGKLAEDTNVFNGVVVKYSEPSEAKKPKRRWRLYVFKGEDVLPFIPLHRQSAYLLGRDRRVADIPVDHPSCSKQHAVLQYRSVAYERSDGSKGRRVRLYVLDLESANGTFVNNKRIDGRRYVELFERDVIKFGFSSREYVLIPEDAGDVTGDLEESQADVSSVGQVSSL